MNWLLLVLGSALAILPRIDDGSFNWGRSPSIGRWGICWRTAAWTPARAVTLRSPHCRTANIGEVVSRGDKWCLEENPRHEADETIDRTRRLLLAAQSMLPWLVTMLTLTWAGSVGTLPVRGQFDRFDGLVHIGTGSYAEVG